MSQNSRLLAESIERGLYRFIRYKPRIGANMLYGYIRALSGAPSGRRTSPAILHNQRRPDGQAASTDF